MKEYFVMAQRVGNDALMQCGPTLNEERGIWSFEHGCPASSDKGCVLAYSERPLVCKIYPWVPVLATADEQKEPIHKLMLDVARCEQWKAFGDYYAEFKQEYENGREKETI
jgi:Fe-S-cluster containining protein